MGNYKWLYFLMEICYNTLCKPTPTYITGKGGINYEKK